ncbi:MAG: DUF4405 domain-containing protein [Bacilli bacterium]|nr:DUF4405 domain-containing protein [Bacilli bacterium]
MIILLLLITNTNITGVLIHEILGVLIFVVFAIHLYLNWNSIKIMLNKFKNNNLSKDIKINLVVDILLFIMFLIITISGILISKNLFTFMNINYNINIYYIHVYGTYLAIVLLLIHIINHLKIINLYYKKITNKKNERKVIIYISIISLLFIYNLFKDEILNIFNKKDETAIKENNNYDDGQDDDDDDNSSNTNNDDENNRETLADYLSKLFCNGCHRHCPLSNPQCGIGENKKEQATEQYYNESE